MMHVHTIIADVHGSGFMPFTHYAILLCHSHIMPYSRAQVTVLNFHTIHKTVTAQNFCGSSRTRSLRVTLTQSI